MSNEQVSRAKSDEEFVECMNCDEGEVAVGTLFVTREMALDAGIPELEGTIYDVETDMCECCYGNWQACERCTAEVGGTLPWGEPHNLADAYKNMDEKESQ